MRCSALECPIGLDRGASAEFAFDCLGDAASLARDIDLELVVGRGVVAAIAAVGDDAGEVGADLRLDLRDHGRKRVAVIRVAGAWAMNWPPLERLRVVAIDTLTPNS
jgi:hypothetical protein